MNRRDLHQFHLSMFGQPNCGRLHPVGYSTNWWMSLWVLNFSIWKTMPRTAQCRRCRKGKGHAWASDEQITAVEVALLGIAEVFRRPWNYAGRGGDVGADGTHGRIVVVQS